jgi:hypothetical protein
MHRSKQDWLGLIQEFEASGLSQTNFCNVKGLDAKYFSLKRSRLLPSAAKVGKFVKVSPPVIVTGTTTLQFGQVRINFSQDTPLQVIAGLARELA